MPPTTPSCQSMRSVLPRVAVSVAMRFQETTARK
jgi:hypothetical protein